jgi:Kef-type K+ transport system membrane component KefB
VLHQRLGLLLVQLIVIIGLSRLLGLGARWLRQPLVMAEMLVGLLLGPSVLGGVAPRLMQALFPADSLPLLKALSQVGLVLFMFLVGLELDLRLLRGRGHAMVAISHVSILTPFGLGMVMAAWLYPRLSGPGVGFLSFASFMGVAMSITAFPVLARILSEQRMLQSRVGSIALPCAAVDDVTAWCLLALVVSLARAAGLRQAAWTVLLSLLFIATMLGVVRPLVARLELGRHTTNGGLTQCMGALVLLLASSLSTELIGIHALFGAFLCGVIIPRERGAAAALARRLEREALVLLPVFFAYSGLRTQVGLLAGVKDWALCGLITLVACVGKFGGCSVVARLTGVRWREACALGVLMNTRGLMELIVLNVGLDMKVISPALFTMMVIMALVSTFITTPLLRWIHPSGSAAGAGTVVQGS